MLVFLFFAMAGVYDAANDLRLPPLCGCASRWFRCNICSSAYRSQRESGKDFQIPCNVPLTNRLILIDEWNLLMWPFCDNRWPARTKPVRCEQREVSWHYPLAPIHAELRGFFKMCRCQPGNACVLSTGLNRKIAEPSLGGAAYWTKDQRNGRKVRADHAIRPLCRYNSLLNKPGCASITYPYLVLNHIFAHLTEWDEVLEGGRAGKRIWPIENPRKKRQESRQRRRKQRCCGNRRNSIWVTKKTKNKSGTWKGKVAILNYCRS